MEPNSSTHYMGVTDGEQETNASPDPSRCEPPTQKCPFHAQVQRIFGKRSWHKPEYLVKTFLSTSNFSEKNTKFLVKPNIFLVSS